MNNNDEILKFAIEVANQEEKVKSLERERENLQKQLADLNTQIKKEDEIHIKLAQSLFEKTSQYPNDKSIVFNFGDKILAITKATNKARYAEYYNTIPANESLTE